MNNHAPPSVADDEVMRTVEAAEAVEEVEEVEAGAEVEEEAAVRVQTRARSTGMAS